MKKISIIGIFLLFGFTVITPTSQFTMTSSHVLRNSLSIVESSLQRLKDIVKTQNEDSIKALYHISRNNYKQCEFIIEYYDGALVSSIINAAPLPKLNPSSAQTDILEPHGFQVLDEIIYADDQSLEQRSDAIIKEIDYILHSLHDFSLLAQGIHIEKRHLLESIQLGLLRVVSLGITGFDTPGSDNAIGETSFVLQSMAQYISLLQPLSTQEKKSLQQTVTLCKQASQYCKKNKNFDTFDRASFIREYAEPLYKKIQALYTDFSIEYYDETTTRSSSINFRSPSLFSTTLFSASYYTRQMPQDINDTRKYLGKLLFFDPILSRNSERSCASCHQPEKAFTDGLPTSMAFNKQGNILRNAPTLINAIYAGRLFYDLRAHSFEDQVQHVVTDENEFHTDFSTIISDVSSSDEYKELFKKSFPEIKHNNISPYTISAALAAYQMTLVSFNSDFDKYMRSEKKSVSREVKNGFNLFMGKAACGTCHFVPTFAGLVPPRFTESESEILGILQQFDTLSPKLDTDAGRYAGHAKDQVALYKRSFKTMTVRNSGLTAPYFHNGKFKTLEQVLEFYDHGGGAGLGLDVPYQTLPSDKLHLTKNEKRDIIAFLHSLTDTTGLTNKPSKLPAIESQKASGRTIGGLY
ncbi:MAG: cytochrome-c peroxidase [Candidatus Kapabacteria bacterium]|nr:cytochrome-c peroxidase [Candidatus Kapabacteria bacterium]